MSEDLSGITLEDIEVMCRILEKFLRTARRVERLLARVAPYRRYGPDGDMWNMVMAQVMQQVAASRGLTLGPEVPEEVGPETFELTEEEKALIQKIRAGRAKKVK